MNSRILFRAFFMICATQAFPAGASAEPVKSSKDTAIRIDVPVKLKKANVVFNMDHLAFQGDLPVGMKYMGLLGARFKEAGTENSIIGVFHGDAGFMLLKDETYNAVRKVTTGNPYKALIGQMIEKGVQIEECAVTMNGNHWSNEDLLPAVKVNTGAVIRLIQLHQEGYSEIHP